MLARLEASEALDCLHHAGCRPTQRHGSVSSSFTLWQTRRTVPIMFSMPLVHASERRSWGWQSKVVDGQNFIEPLLEGWRQLRAPLARGGERDCATAFRPCRRRRVPMLAAVPCAPKRHGVALLCGIDTPSLAAQGGSIAPRFFVPFRAEKEAIRLPSCPVIAALLINAQFRTSALTHPSD